MGPDRSPSTGGDAPQDEQLELLRETGNGSTDPNEELLLREEFGPPDANGVFGAVKGEP
ncbi:hypothetical protein CLV63_101492 [Murinocardiopsis flavida]|uniref:Uncharacterized protein n=1 Tax=Murinocardiopsis flavida TaxID=645275 RepID=A0A2P8DUV8_9ACTN|nr:hypothetical protein [Murinocardiopsis flavida]PSL01013.1 hypothetical protein CLV63_101492 [Murinocardiopsis flavida]